MKKILILNVLYKPNIGGIENSIDEISNVFYSSGYNIDILCSDKNNETEKSLDFFEELDGKTVYRYEYVSGQGVLVRNFIKARSSLKKLLKNNKYDLFLSRSYFLVIVGYFSGVKNVKYIVPEVTFYSNKKSKEMKNFKKTASFCVKVALQWLAFILSKDVYVFSQSMTKQVKKASLGLVNPTLIEPGINLNKFSLATTQEKKFLRSKYDLPDSKIILLGLGRFSEVKQYHLAILAMNDVPEDFLLVLVGSGPEFCEYQNLVNNYQLANKVVFFEATDCPEEFYKLSDIFLMTSRYESFGQTILEAAVSGLKIIAFSEKSGVNTNVVNMLSDFKGLYLVDKQSKEDLSKNILIAAYDICFTDEDYLAANSALKTRYSWDKLVSGIGVKF